MSLMVFSSSAGATQALGRALGERAEGPLAILLAGDYGTGKTTFVQGLAAGLGVSEVVRSPSYNIMKVYTTGRLVLVHADFYRTNGSPDIEELGLLEAMGDSGILAVEWPGTYQPSVIEMESLSLKFKLTNGEGEPTRAIMVDGTPGCWAWVEGVLHAFAAG